MGVKRGTKRKQARAKKVSYDIETEPSIDLKELKPIPVSQVDLAFPAHAHRLMPPMEAIPEEFRHDGARSSPVAEKWLGFQRQWFYKGLEGVKFARKEGIDAETAFRHLQCIQGSFQPKHEHKVAAVAYLASLWFEDYELPEAKAAP